MKKHILFACIILFFSIYLKAQNTFTSEQYYVGVPVDDTLFSSTNSANCSAGASIYLDTLMIFHDFHFPYVTGVDIKVIITSGSAIGIQPGDTFLLDNTHYSVSAGFLGSGSFSFIIKAIGIPSIVGEKYYCNWGWTRTTCLCCSDLWLVVS